MQHAYVSRLVPEIASFVTITATERSIDPEIRQRFLLKHASVYWRHASRSTLTNFFRDTDSSDDQ
jgi:hypothetical protein